MVNESALLPGDRGLAGAFACSEANEAFEIYVQLAACLCSVSARALALSEQW